MSAQLTAPVDVNLVNKSLILVLFKKEVSGYQAAFILTKMQDSFLGWAPAFKDARMFSVCVPTIDSVDWLSAFSQMDEVAWAEIAKRVSVSPV